MAEKSIKKKIPMAAAVLLIILLMTVGYVKNIYAATMDISTSASNIDIGEGVTVEISSEGVDASNPMIAVYYDADCLELEACSAEYTGGDNGILTINASSATLKFLGKQEGTAQIQIKAELSAGGDAIDKSTSVQIGDAAANTGANQSSSAYLKSLNVTPGTMTPAFSPEITSYTIDVAEDVESISVTCSVADSNSKVVEAGGFKGLEMGSNDGVITVQAADGSKCTYKLTINRGAATKTEDAEDIQDDEVGIMPISATEDTIMIGGDSIYASFLVHSDFPADLLPDGFIQEEYNYKGVPVQSAYFAAGNLRLLYLTAGDGTSGDFRIYYEDTDEFMDFLQLKGTDGKYIMPVRYQAQIKIPDNYTGSFMPWGDKVIYCYIYTELTDKPIVTSASTEEEIQAAQEANAQLVNVDELDEEVEFYLLYAMNNEGTENFYLYDYVEGTYQRYVERDTSYDLDQSYFKYKDIAHQRFSAICILVTLLVIAVFCIINLILRNKELKADLGADDPENKENGEGPDDDDEPGDDEPGDDSNEDEESEPEESEPVPESENEEDEANSDDVIEDAGDEGIEETDDDSLEAKIINQIQVQESDVNPEREEKAPVTRKPSAFKMINLSREPEPTGLDDDFEFEFINLDDD